MGALFFNKFSFFENKRICVRVEIETLEYSFFKSIDKLR